MTRIVIVDDHPIFRKGLSLTLSEAENFVICGEGATAQEAVDLVERHNPDVLLLDLSMPGGGLAALVDILARNPATRVIVLTASEDGEDVRQALQTGAQGYLLKGVGGKVLIDVIRNVANGEGYVSPGLAARVLSQLRVGEGTATGVDVKATANREALLSQLTPRETEILDLVAAGLSNKEIARQAALQEKTVKHHMTRILHKLNVRNRTEAALLLKAN
ncbi:response regulator transcription factor [Rhizobiaceae bacterium BDR2-2]|uniref:Response regulator transcription factor n=1 Tax=Ectorhizobium quercum TaxID=2965071 RepID=A0AAE3MYX3_9HYPH|nr:response regulator transcription factor [Ectorhizobium quercum]MCX8997031.1 response regulator transcription factor [Ectorhizobium quercum]